MSLTKLERKRKNNPANEKTNFLREKNRLKRAKKNEAKEKEMADHLVASGWKCSGPFKDVWKISNWDEPGICFRTLRQAYKIQYKLDSNHNSGIDDNLVNSIVG